MEIKTKFNQKDDVWLINGMTPSRGKVDKVFIEINSWGKIETIQIAASQDLFHIDGLYTKMAFATEEEFVKELIRRIHGGKY